MNNTKRIIVVDSRISEKCRKTLENMNFSLITVPKDKRFDAPVSAHTDIFVFKYKNDILLYNNMSEMFSKQMFDSEDGPDKYNIRQINCLQNADFIRYPDDCKLNFEVCGDKIIGNFKNSADEITEIAEKYDLKRINVKQGYAACNICVVSENSIITEDEGIAKECLKHGMDVLLLNQKEVKLDGYENGFIGGASFNYEIDGIKNVFFFGDIKKHSEYIQIKDFCDKYNVNIISLSNEKLYDFGGAVVI